MYYIPSMLSWMTAYDRGIPSASTANAKYQPKRSTKLKNKRKKKKK